MRKLLGVALFSFMTASGLIDTYRVHVPSLNRFDMYTEEELHLSEWVKEHTYPASIWLNADYHNCWLFNLTGRQPVMAYNGWLWTHGYDYEAIRADVFAMYENPFRLDLIHKYGIDFVVVGPIEKRDFRVDLNKFRAAFQTVKQTDNYRIFSTGRSALKKQPKIPVPELTLLQAPKTILDERGLIPGLVKRVYRGRYFYGKPFEKMKSVFDIDLFDDEKTARLYQAPFCVEWDGYFLVKEPGPYSFSLESDDGSFFYLDDYLVIDNGGLHRLLKKTTSVRLSEGFHKLKLRYFDNGGGAVMRLRWTKPGEREQPIPKTSLFY